MTATPWFYIGLVLVVAGSWIWCVLMLVAMWRWKRENPGKPVPLAMFATVANAVMWLWTTVGVAAELGFQALQPAAFAPDLLFQPAASGIDHDGGFRKRLASMLD